MNYTSAATRSESAGEMPVQSRRQDMKRFRLVIAVAAGLLIALPAAATPERTAIAIDEYSKVIARASAPGAGWLWLAPAAARTQIDTIRPFVLDVRRVDEFNAQRIAGSVLIPVTELHRRLAELPADRTAPIIIYCKTGIRSSYGLGMLHLAGFTNSRNMIGGIDAWIAAGLPTVTGPPR